MSAKTDERIRKVGEYQDTTVRELSPAEIEGERSKICDLLGRRDNLEGALKATKAEYRAKLESIKDRIERALNTATTGRQEIEVDIEEWLTRGNEIVRVRADTGEVLTRRTATASELQENLFPPAPKPPKASKAAKGDSFPTSEEAFGGDGVS